MSSRKRSASTPPPVNVGPVWLVKTLMVERYVAAATAVEAIEVFRAAVMDGGTADDLVREVTLVALEVHASAGVSLGKTDRGRTAMSRFGLSYICGLDSGEAFLAEDGARVYFCRKEKEVLGTDEFGEEVSATRIARYPFLVCPDGATLDELHAARRALVAFHEPVGTPRHRRLASALAELGEVLSTAERAA